MGLYVHSLGEIPSGGDRAYYVYLLDYGWEEALSGAVRANLPRMADMASRSNAVVIHGPRGVHFEEGFVVAPRKWKRRKGNPSRDSCYYETSIDIQRIIWRDKVKEGKSRCVAPDSSS